MPVSGFARRRARAVLGASLATVLSVPVALAALVGAATVASADTDPVAPSSAATPTVTADALPTVQVNGVVWAQTMIGNTVYAVGSFTSARPAGAAAGTDETPRANILAYDVTTGVLVPGFAPVLDQQARTVVASPDGSKLYVGGDFTSVNGVVKNRIAALNPTTGALITPFAASVNAKVSTLAVGTNGVLYAGGQFSTSSGTARSRLAAFSQTTGALLSWAPVSDREVMSMTYLSASNTLVVGGRFTTLNGAANYGLGALDATTGTTGTWPANLVVRNAGDNTGIVSLTNDGTAVYGTGYTFGSGGNLENAFSTDLAGNLTWVSGCLGDTYSNYPIGGVLYIVGHSHNCSPLGAFPQTNPWTYQRAMAYTTGAGAHGETNLSGNFTGRPAPEMLHWEPTLDVGTITGQDQAAWSVTGNGQYVVLGGEFPRVNYTNQAGLVRFAVSSLAPNKQGPTTPAEMAPTATPVAGGVKVSWTASWDRDSRRITYLVLRDGVPIGSIQADSTWWDRPSVAWTDTTAPANTAVSYQIRAKDTYGTTVTGPATSVTTPAAASPAAGGYANAVRADGATSYWRLDEATGTTATDWAGGRDLTVQSTATRNVTGALASGTDTATTFAGGTSGVPATSTVKQLGPETFTEEAWFSTTSTQGGKILGFGASSTGDSSTADRQLYLSNTGALTFGVTTAGTARTVSTTTAYNDGQWHHVVATLGDAAGMQLYVDGRLVGSRPDTTYAQMYYGYWRIAGDTVNTIYPNRPTRTRLAGSIDEVAVYPTVLSATQVATHYALGHNANQAPTASFTVSATQLAAAFDATASADADGTVAAYAWDFGDGTTGTGPAASHTYAAPGTYTATLTVTDDAGATASTSRTVTARVNQAPTASFTSSVTDLTASLNASGSTDADGSIASYAWDFGDSTTGSGVSPTHAYAAAGTYTVALTVKDDEGGTVTSSAPVTVTAPSAGSAVASDTFGRSVASGWGTADQGGAWTASGGTASVADGAGRLVVGAGVTSTLRLASTSIADVDVTHTVSLDALPTGGGEYISDVLRRTTTGDYRTKVQVLATGAVKVQIVKVVGGTETALTSSATVAGLTVTPGSPLSIRSQAQGSSPTTLRVKVWASSGSEPSAWNQTVGDSTTGLQTAGSLGVVAFTSGSATAPVSVRVDNLTATRL